MARAVITLLISTVVPQVLCHSPGSHHHHNHHFMGPMNGHHHSLDLGLTAGDGGASRGLSSENRSLPQPLHSRQFDQLGHHEPLRREYPLRPTEKSVFNGLSSVHPMSNGIGCTYDKQAK